MLEVIDAVGRVTGKEVPVTEEPRRAGDPATLVASGQKAREVLGWAPQHSLEDIIADAWKALEG